MFVFAATRALDARSHDENINMIMLLLIRVIDLRIL